MFLLFLKGLEKIIPKKDDEELMKKRILFDFYKEIKNMFDKRTKKFSFDRKMKNDIKESDSDEDLNTFLETLLLDNIIVLCPNNKDIQKENKLDFEIKIKDLYEEYINSEQFQKAVKKLSDEEKSYEYIYNYINTSKDLLSYFKSTDNKKK